MVLEEAISGDQDSFSPSSDDGSLNNGDAIASLGKHPVKQYNLDATKIPQPIPFIGPLLGFGEKGLRFRLNAVATSTYQSLKRPLTLEETQAAAEHFGRSLQISSYGSALGLLGSIYYSSMALMQGKFPFAKAPDPATFNAEVFGPLRGQAARVGRGALIILAYTSLGIVVADLPFNAYATASLARAFTTDPRLKEVSKSMKKMALERPGRLPAGQPSDEGIKGEVQEPMRNRRGGWSGRQQNTDDDDMSPKAAFETDLMSDEDMQRRQSDVQRRSQERETPEAISGTVGGSYRQTRAQDEGSSAPQAAGPPQSAGSAWDKIRRGQSASQSQTSENRGSWPPRNQNRESQRGPTSGDSFAFTTAEEEKQLAKSEAQREFDARVERERQGEDFGEGRKRW